MPTRRRATTAFGVDIGGSGIKGAIVDLDKGDLSTDRVKYLTPHPSTPEAVADVVARLWCRRPAGPATWARPSRR